MMFNIFDALTPSYNCWFRTVVVVAGGTEFAHREARAAAGARISAFFISVCLQVLQRHRIKLNFVLCLACWLVSWWLLFCARLTRLTVQNLQHSKQQRSA